MLYLSTNDDAAGIVYSATATFPSGLTQSQSTRISGTESEKTSLGYAIGEFELGGDRDGRVGTVTWSASKNGVAISTPQLLLLRVSEETGFTSYVGPSASRPSSLTIESPSAELPRGGVFITDPVGADRSALSNVRSLDTRGVVLQPGRCAVFVVSNPFGDASGSRTATFSFYERHHTYVTAD